MQLRAVEGHPLKLVTAHAAANAACTRRKNDLYGVPVYTQTPIGYYPTNVTPLREFSPGRNPYGNLTNVIVDWNLVSKFDTLLSPPQTAMQNWLFNETL